MVDLATPGQSGFVNRMIRAAKLQVLLYEEVEADISATSQAMLVVVLVAVLHGIAAALGGGNPLIQFIAALINDLVAWALWSFVFFIVGTRVFGGTATYGEMLRTLGFAATPLLLLLFSFLPLVGFIAFVWWLIASFIATRQALDIDNTKTFFTVVVGMVAVALVVFAISAILRLIFGLGLAVGRLL